MPAASTAAGPAGEERARSRSRTALTIALGGVPSCHAVWMELHEDLLSIVGLPREPGPHRRSETS